MVSRTDPETMRLLDEVIILFMHANPDGHELVLASLNPAHSRSPSTAFGRGWGPPPT